MRRPTGKKPRTSLHIIVPKKNKTGPLNKKKQLHPFPLQLLRSIAEERRVEVDVVI